MADPAAAEGERAVAERLAELADVADLMDDADGARRLRLQAAQAGDRAMRHLDDDRSGR